MTKNAGYEALTDRVGMDAVRFFADQIEENRACDSLSGCRTIIDGGGGTEQSRPLSYFVKTSIIYCFSAS